MLVCLFFAITIIAFSDTLDNNINRIIQAFEGFLDQRHGTASQGKQKDTPQFRRNATEPKTFNSIILLYY